MKGLLRLLPLFALVACGCGPKPAAPPAMTVPAAKVWGEAPAPLAVVETALSPALLVQSAPGPLRLFAGRAPGGMAWSAPAGQRLTNAATRIEGASLAEGWLLVWWAGASGWTNGDSAVALLLGRRPQEVAFSADGLTLEFPAGSGQLVVLPLFGVQRLAGPGQDLPATPGRKKPWPSPWRWTNGLPREPLTRLRYWQAITRYVPVSVDPRTGPAALFESFGFLPLGGDWPVTPMKLAPVRPAVAGALLPGGGAPVEISPRAHNHELPTTRGPLFGVQNADGYTARWPGGSAPVTAWPTNGMALTLRTRTGNWPELRLGAAGGEETSLGEIRLGTNAAPASFAQVPVSPLTRRMEFR